ncbi:MAG TPA: DUF4920 domain-containing protein, partial [Flavobacterium sp.]|nr:DUF4920 domain-containing protein [Flavobacterium sp.]
MKNLMMLAACILLLSACKNNESETAPDPVLETPSDSISKDTVATVVSPAVEEVAEDAKIIEVSAAKDKVIKVEYASFGAKIAADKALTNAEMLKKYKTLQKGDTIAVKFKSKIKDVCKKKGCWMKMDLADNKESFVRFKDYGFFVPLNADNSEAIVSGRAFLDVISVDELKHYAKDGGKSQEEIDQIT